ncbi:protein SCO1/2 [Zhouia amylolytica]|uniref:Protein SCO1/2 n=1 Tax=Zhouia amylolytica TaxID=376730 RepID=A0A1I6VCW7_9FLAO|nr:SCO family protein [Zhouia amylolytica]SFT11482.1 protein SCO1/2 [Zhouia amylolytica]
MKNKSYIWVGLVILIFGIIFIPEIVNRIKDNDVVDEDRHKVGQKKAELVKLGKVPAFTFINQNNDTISDKYYAGKVYVVEFFFTTCPTICPIMNTNMLKLQESFRNENDFGVASFTINPKNDTPEVLKEYAQKYGITHPNWNLLTGDREMIYGLSNTGFNLYAGQNANVEGGFEHSGLFALIDKEGNITCRTDQFGNPKVYYDGVGENGDGGDIELLKEDIKQLLNE